MEVKPASRLRNAKELASPCASFFFASVVLRVRLDRRLGVETERSGVPHRESKPSAHRHRTARIARTTRQINGAMDFCG